jgi:diacylglycerol kinase (ATP)
MVARVIINPYSGRWKARRLWPAAESALKAAGINFEFVETTAPGEGIHLAEESVLKGYSPIIAAGGDGAISEVVNGMYRATPSGVLGPLGVVPLGTANDLAINLGLPLDLDQAARIIAGGKTKRIDLGKANHWVFDNNSAVGLEPVVTIHNIEMVRLKGVIRYLVAALKAIWENPKWTVKLEWDEGRYEGLISLVTVGNCPITGGLFRMAPAADPMDGKITFVYGYAPTRLKMLSLLPRAINGSYVHDQAIHQHHTRKLRIEIQPGSPIQVDGEIRDNAIVRVEYESLPGKLDIFTG